MSLTSIFIRSDDSIRLPSSVRIIRAGYCAITVAISYFVSYME